MNIFVWLLWLKKQRIEKNIIQELFNEIHCRQIVKQIRYCVWFPRFPLTPSSLSPSSPLLQSPLLPLPFPLLSPSSFPLPFPLLPSPPLLLQRLTQFQDFIAKLYCQGFFTSIYVSSVQKGNTWFSQWLDNKEPLNKVFFFFFIKQKGKYKQLQVSRPKKITFSEGGGGEPLSAK